MGETEDWKALTDLYTKGSSLTVLHVMLTVEELRRATRRGA